MPSCGHQPMVLSDVVYLPVDRHLKSLLPKMYRSRTPTTTLSAPLETMLSILPLQYPLLQMLWLLPLSAGYTSKPQHPFSSSLSLPVPYVFTLAGEKELPPVPATGQTLLTIPLRSADTIVPIEILLVIEPCIAIIGICLPTIGPALQDIASYSTIEYKKMMCRIKMATERERSPSVERAEIYAPIDKSGMRIYEHLQDLSPDVESQSLIEQERARKISQHSLMELPEKPAMARLKWSSV
ncbi:MAG: hypothetical protein Q9168_007334 [Polycauliona sp. 1 TL-2023]